MFEKWFPIATIQLQSNFSILICVFFLRMHKRFSRWFTLSEILIAILIIAVWLSGVIFAINQSLRYVEQLKRRTFAMNLAKEWIEDVYQIRNTNRKMRPDKKDQCWLKQDPMGTNCETEPWMNTWYYRIFYTWSSNLYWYLRWWNTDGLNLDDGIQTGDLDFAICRNAQWMFVSCPGIDSTQSIKFFRVIEGKGVFLKNPSNVVWWTQIDCPDGTSVDPGTSIVCGSGDAKEYRFCSRVTYIWSQNGDVEFCWIMTNFR